MITRLMNKASSMEQDKIVHYALRGVIIVLSLALLELIWSSFRAATYKPSAQVANIKHNGKQANNYNASQIAQRNLFGQAANVNQESSWPTTRLELTLRGAFTSNNPAQASAMIEGPDGKTHSYKVNSEVYGNAKLHSVHTDRVVLSQGGQLETLFFPVALANNSSTTASGFDSSQVPDDIKKLVRDNASPSEISAVTRQLKTSAMTSEQRQQLIRERLQELRNRSRQ